MNNPPPDPVALLEELALRVATHGRSALDLWQFTAILARISEQRPDYIASLSEEHRQLFFAALDAPLRGFFGRVQ